MSLLSRLLGKSSAPEAAPVIHKDFRIYPEPAKAGSAFRIAARIEKDIDGEVKTHSLIRADTYESAERAAEASVAKAKQLIDEQGEAIFR